MKPLATLRAERRYGLERTDGSEDEVVKVGQFSIGEPLLIRGIDRMKDFDRLLFSDRRVKALGDVIGVP